MNTPIQRFEITGTPRMLFERVDIVLICPFHPSPQRNKYVLAIIDHLAGWAESFPIPNKFSETVLKKF